MAKAGLSWAGDVASQCKARSGVHSLGESVDKLLHSTEVLTLAVAEIHQSKAGE